MQKIKLNQPFSVPFDYNPEDYEQGIDGTVLYEDSLLVPKVGILQIQVMRLLFDPDNACAYKTFDGLPFTFGLTMPAYGAKEHWKLCLPATLFFGLQITNEELRTKSFVDRLSIELNHKEYGIFEGNKLDTFDYIEAQSHFLVTLCNYYWYVNGEKKLLFFEPTKPEDLRNAQFTVKCEDWS